MTDANGEQRENREPVDDAGTTKNAAGHVADQANEAKDQVEGAVAAGVEAGQQKLQQAQSAVAREREPRWRVLLRGRVVLLAYAIILAVVVALTIAVRMNSVLPGDLPFTRELQESNSPILNAVMYFVSSLGFSLQSAVIEILAFLILWLFRLRIEAIFVVVSLLADLLGGILKIVVGRHRPTPDLVHVMQTIQQPSFPSGHTLHYTVFYGFLLFVVATNFKRSWPRAALLIIFALLILLVGPSRVYLGEHWPTDVLGGYLIGALCLGPLIGGYLWVKARYTIADARPFIRRLPPPTPPPTPADAQRQTGSSSAAR